MRTAIISLCLLLTVLGCETANTRARFAPLAEDFFAAASSGDSVRLSKIVADTLVLRDLAVIASEQPGLLRDAARGLDLQRGGKVSSDSAYLFFRPRGGEQSRGVDIGFVRKAEAWRVYYVGLTGSDLRPPAGRS